MLAHPGRDGRGRVRLPGRPPIAGPAGAHIRAVLAARLWLSASPAWDRGQPWWNSERCIRADRPGPAAGHLPDAEIHWPSTGTCPYPGQVWAVEVELTAKSVGRTMQIMAGLLSPVRYAQVLYLTASPARPVVTRSAERVPAGQQARIIIRDLPGTAFTPEAAAS